MPNVKFCRLLYFLLKPIWTSTTFYQIPLHRSEVHGMKTQPFNEATISGISNILDASLELGVKKYEAMDRGWLVAGDLFTLIKIDALQNVRVRDFRYVFFLNHNRHSLTYSAVDTIDMIRKASVARLMPVSTVLCVKANHLIHYLYFSSRANEVISIYII